MPLLSLLTGADLNGNGLRRRCMTPAATKCARRCCHQLRSFLSTILDIDIIIAFAVFCLIKAIAASTERRRPLLSPAPALAEEVFAGEIRDLLKDMMNSACNRVLRPEPPVERSCSGPV